MGFKIAFIFGVLLMAVTSGSFMYIKYLNAEIGVLKGNQVVLETKITEQNESIKNYLAKQEKITEQLSDLEAQKNVAQREVNDLRNKFAKHDLNTLAMAKPKMLETRINRATQRVFDGLVEMTKPEKYNDKNN